MVSTGPIMEEFHGVPLRDSFTAARMSWCTKQSMLVAPFQQESRSVVMLYLYWTSESPKATRGQKYDSLALASQVWAAEIRFGVGA